MSITSEATQERLVGLPLTGATGIAKSKKAKPVTHLHNWDSAELTAAFLTTSACLHLLVTGIVGYGVREDPVRLIHKEVEPPPAAIEEVKLEEPPPEIQQEKQEAPSTETQTIDLPAAAANVDLPPIPDTAEISAVPASVPVAFAIPVKGKVRLVNDASKASGAVGGRASRTGPVSVDTGAEHARFLLRPTLVYPTVARERHITGDVEVEFHTTPTGEITDVKVRTSSGHSELDFAALQNIRKSRWTGEAGFFVKTFNFIIN